MPDLDSLSGLLEGIGGGSSKYGYTNSPNVMDVMNKGMDFYQKMNTFSKNLQLEDSANRLLDVAKSRGGDISQLNFNDVNSIYDMQALGSLLKTHASNNEARINAMKKQDEADTMHYNNNILPRMNIAMRAFQSGDLDGFAVNAEQLANMIGTPYRIKSDGQGGFDMYFRSDEKLGFTPTGQKLSAQQAYAMMQDLVNGTQYTVMGANGQRIAVNPQYNAWAARQRMATERGNIDAALNPRLMIGPNGQRVYAAPQNQWGNYNADTDVLLFDAATGQKVGQVGASELGKQGYRWANEIDTKAYAKALGLTGTAGRGGGGGGKGGSSAMQAAGVGGGAPIKLDNGRYAVTNNIRDFIAKQFTLFGENNNSQTNWVAANLASDIYSYTGAHPHEILGMIELEKARILNDPNNKLDEDQALIVAARNCQANVKTMWEQSQIQEPTQEPTQQPTQTTGNAQGNMPGKSQGNSAPQGYKTKEEMQKEAENNRKKRDDKNKSSKGINIFGINISHGE